MRKSVQRQTAPSSDSRVIARETIVVAGEFEVGKSSVVNALLRRPLLPNDPGFLSRPLIRIRHRAVESFVVELTNGDSHKIDSLDEIVERSDVSTVVIHVPMPGLEAVEIVEVPFHPSRGIAEENLDLMRQASLFVWVTIGSQAWRLSEKSIVEALPEDMPERSILAISRADKLRSATDLDKIEARLQREAVGLFSEIVFMQASVNRLQECQQNEQKWEETGGQALVDIARDTIGDMQISDEELRGAFQAVEFGRRASDRSEDLLPNVEFGQSAHPVTENIEQADQSAPLRNFETWQSFPRAGFTQETIPTSDAEPDTRNRRDAETTLDELLAVVELDEESQASKPAASLSDTDADVESLDFDEFDRWTSDASNDALVEQVTEPNEDFPKLDDAREVDGVGESGVASAEAPEVVPFTNEEAAEFKQWTSNASIDELAEEPNEEISDAAAELDGVVENDGTSLDTSELVTDDESSEPNHEIHVVETKEEKLNRAIENIKGLETAGIANSTTRELQVCFVEGNIKADLFMNTISDVVAANVKMMRAAGDTSIVESTITVGDYLILLQMLEGSEDNFAFFVIQRHSTNAAVSSVLAKRLLSVWSEN